MDTPQRPPPARQMMREARIRQLKALMAKADSELVALVTHPDVTPEMLAEAVPLVRASRARAKELFAIAEDKLRRNV